MNTSTVQIELPEEVRTFAEEQTALGGYPSIGDYVQALLAEEMKRRAQQNLETLLLAGLQSGLPVAVTTEFWNELRQARSSQDKP